MAADQHLQGTERRFVHREGEPEIHTMYVEKMRDPGIRYSSGSTHDWKNPAGPFAWHAYVPVPDEPGLVYRVRGWSNSRWAAGAEAMHTYVDRFVPGRGLL